MLDQSFSSENFRKIFDIENRKGIYLEGDFYPDLIVINNDIKKTIFELKLLKKKGLTKEAYEAEKDKLNDKKETLKEGKENLLLEKLAIISSTVTDSKFKLKIIEDTTITSKPVYKTLYNLENILTLKQLQYNFRKIYKVKQSNRYSIVSQLKNLLDDGFPKVILKTDIKEFYESLPHDKLLKKLNDESLLTHLSQRFIQQILSEYEAISGTSNGVPRGIGISPYIVELYMRDIDLKIKNIPNVLYYARYVDDIIILFMPQIDNNIRDYKTEIKNILTSEGLIMNEADDKTKIIDLRDKTSNINYEFEYLGYKFISGYSGNKHIPLTLTISERKKKRYAERLAKAIALYQTNKLANEKIARKLFVKRVRFLTSNTRLVNNKKNVITGVYYTNSLINTVADLKSLDRFFSSQITKSPMAHHLKIRVTRDNSFEKGFNPSSISKFNANELRLIVKNWTK